MLVNEINAQHMASTETQRETDGPMQVKNELRAELQVSKIFNAQLGLQCSKAHGLVMKLNMQLDAAENEINRLDFEVQRARHEVNGLKILVKKLYETPVDASLDYSTLWPKFGATPINGDALPTPPLSTQGIPEQPLTPKASHVIHIRSPEPETARPSASIARNGTVLYDPLGIQHKAAIGQIIHHQNAAKSKPKARGIIRGGPHVDESFARIKNNLALMDKTNGSDLLRDFSWPQATLIQDVTKRLNPDQDSVRIMGPSEGSVSPSSGRATNVPPSRVESKIANGLEETLATLNDRSRPTPAKPEMMTLQGPKPIHATISTIVKPNIPVDSFINSPGSLKPPLRTATATSKVTDNVIVTRNAKPIPPHLRGLPPKAAPPRFGPAVTSTTQFKPVTVIAPFKDTGITNAEAQNMKTWLDTLEKKAIGLSVSDGRSNLGSASGDWLIDLNGEDTGRPSLVQSLPGSALGANVPTKVQKSRVALENEGYNVDISADPYLKYLRPVTAPKEHPATISKEQNKAYISNNLQAAPMAEADTTVRYEDDFSISEEVAQRLTSFKTQLPTTRDESNIATRFLTAYKSKLLEVKSKYGDPVKSERGFESKGPPVKHHHHEIDSDFVAPRIVGTHTLGDLLDSSTKLMVMSGTPHSHGRDLEVKLEWKAVIKNGRTVFVL